MSDFTNYAAQAALNAIFGKLSNWGALASAPTLHVGLSTTTPLADGTNFTEPSTGSPSNGYARVATAAGVWNPATLADPSVLDNASEIAFPEALSSWGTMTYFGLFDALSGGNLLAFDLLRDPNDLGDPPAALSRLVDSGVTLRFAAGNLSFRLT